MKRIVVLLLLSGSALAHDPCEPDVFNSATRQCEAVMPPQAPGVCTLPAIVDNPNESHPCSDGTTADAGPIGSAAPPNHAFRNAGDGHSWAMDPGNYSSLEVVSNDHQRYCTSPGYTHSRDIHVQGQAIELSGNFSGTITGDVPFILNGVCVSP